MDQITLGDGAAVFPNLIRVAAKHIAVNYACERCG